MQDDELRSLEKLCEEATPGPWKRDSISLIRQEPDGWIVAYADMDADTGERNARFIAAAREAVPKLIAALREARAFAEEACERYNASLKLTCAFCGHVYEDGTPTSRHDRLTAHVQECEAHPLRAERDQLRARARELERQNEGLEQESMGLRQALEHYL